MLLNSSEQERRCSQTTHNPAKLPEVDTLVAKYGEVRLLKMMRKKYSAASGGGWPGTPPGAPKPAGPSGPSADAQARRPAPAPAAQPANMLEVTFATTGPLGMTWVPDQVHHPDGSGRLTEVCVLKEMKGGSPAVRRPLRFDPPQCPSDQLLHMIPSWDRKEISRNTRSR